LTSALDGGDWSATRPGRFTPGETAPGTHYTGVWLGPRAGLYVMEKIKISAIKPRSCSLSLYRLSYLGSHKPPGSHWIYGWVGLSAGVDVTEKRKIAWPRRELNPGRPTLR
jgi:hypothetical protein